MAAVVQLYLTKANVRRLAGGGVVTKYRVAVGAGAYQPDIAIAIDAMTWDNLVRILEAALRHAQERATPPSSEAPRRG